MNPGNFVRNTSFFQKKRRKIDAKVIGKINKENGGQKQNLLAFCGKNEFN